MNNVIKLKNNQKPVLKQYSVNTETIEERVLRVKDTISKIDKIIKELMSLK